MQSVRRSLALGALLGLLILAAPLFGDGGPATGQGQPDAGRGAVQPHAAAWLKPELGKRLAQEPVLTYDTIAGERFFALQLQPKLTSKFTGPRDYLVLVDSTASQAGGTFLAARLLAAQLTRSLGQQDRLALWEVNDKTTELTTGFVPAGDAALKTAIERLDKVTPMGAADLKAAIAKASGAFENQAGRQQVIFYIGDGMSTLNPISAADRERFAQSLVERRVQFFPLLLGPSVDVLDPSALAVLTGGVVLRLDPSANPVRTITAIQETMSQPVLFGEEFTMGAGVTEYFPTKLPPLRGDVSTLVVGQMAKGTTDVTARIAGQLLGRAHEVAVTEKVTEPALECYFLVGMAKQWRKAQEKPALMQADYSLAFAFNQSQDAKQEILTQGRQALEFQRFDVAAQLFEHAQQLDPRDVEAETGLKLVAHLQKTAKQLPPQM
ncbi:MAG TPA: hypothetical protein PKD86_10320, partial [Gemmatales bacterium]|nr:hypothetical protein [Gemmatales bacterium]